MKKGVESSAPFSCRRAFLSAVLFPGPTPRGTRRPPLPAKTPSSPARPASCRYLLRQYPLPLRRPFLRISLPVRPEPAFRPQKRSCLCGRMTPNAQAALPTDGSPLPPSLITAALRPGRTCGAFPQGSYASGAPSVQQNARSAPQERSGKVRPGLEYKKA